MDMPAAVRKGTGTDKKSSPKAAKVEFTQYQVFVVAILAFLQFTIILDFMILSPLGAMLMPALKVGPSQFGLVVSAYAFSAGISGLLAAGFADRFDRKKILLFFYVGFICGTLLCGIATTYEFLLFARMITGLFGGVIGSVVFAITTDLFPFQARGRVMGFIQTAFAASQILGIPAGLYLANNWGWHMPFLLIVTVSSLVGVLIWFLLKPINAHLKVKSDRKNPFHHLKATLTTPIYLQAFATTALLSTGGFMLMPFGSAFSVHNLGVDLEKLPMVYMITGLCSIVIGPLVGRLSDAWGKFKVFTFGTVVSIIMVSIYTHLGTTPLLWVIVVNSVMFVGIFSRMIPSQALMSAIPAPASRGSFMSISSSVQQLSGGVASLLAGLIVEEGVGGRIEHFENLGFVVIGTSLITLFMMYKIHRLIPERVD
jgi:predicted MFS family arabinose efflux permease